MIIGVPKERKAHEYRVALTPPGAEMLTAEGHRVIVEKDAGQGSGFTDEEYVRAGAEIVPAPAAVWQRAEMILKVKEPQPEEFAYFRPGLILFTFLHLAAEQRLTRCLLEQRVTAVAYETIQLPDASLPLLTPMSEVAGRMSVQIGAQFLEAFYGGRGVLLGGVPGVTPAKVVIIGGGIVGTNAAKMALGLGADVTVIEKSMGRMRYLDDIFQGKIRTLVSNPYNIKQAVSRADLVIGAVLIPGARAPRVVSEEMVKGMKKGAVIVDVAVDQGGSIATIDHPTTHDDPIYVKHGVIHYAVANIPGAVPRTSTLALMNVTLPYVMELAEKGFERAVSENATLWKGVNTFQGKVTHSEVARSLDLPCTPLEQLMGSSPVVG
jgi:alanine dehydrogenase